MSRGGRSRLGVLAILTLLAVARAASAQADKAKQEVTLQDAIKARTEVTLARQEVDDLSADVRGPMRKLIGKGGAKEMEGNIFLTKDKYAEAVDAFQQAAALYQQAVDGKKVLERLATARRKVARAKLLAEASAPAEKTAEANRMLINAEGYVEAAEFEPAITELEKARKAYEALLAPGEVVTLEQVVAARTGMLAARKTVKGLPALAASEPGSRVRRPTRLEEEKKVAEESPSIEAAPSGKGPRRGSLPDVLGRARSADLAATEALEQREYPPSLALFQTAEKLYREAAGLQVKRESVQASQKAAEDSLKLADKAFQTEARPASFERGKQSFDDGKKALDEEDLDSAKQLFGQAVELFAKAQAGAELANQLSKAQEAWSAALAAADQRLLAQHVGEAFEAAKKQAAAAETEATADKPEAAAKLYTEATAALADAVGEASTKQNLTKAAPVVERLEAAVAKKDKFAAEDLLAEVEKLIPKDERIAALRKSVEAVPGLKKSVSLDLGGGATMELVLIRPGSFMMGDDKSDQKDEKPAHKVTITKPFYMGKYEVTQEQWQALMGSNPSQFKGPKNPVEQVSWEDCQGFLKKLEEKLAASSMKCRLPTEAEWEYACRAGSATKYSFGEEEAKLGDYAWFSGNAGAKTNPVGQKKPNAWGLYDMHGNVYEWCADWHGEAYSSQSSPEDPTGPSSGSSRVLRGGSWTYGASRCRSARRTRFTPTYRDFTYGFRVACVRWVFGRVVLCNSVL